MTVSNIDVVIFIKFFLILFTVFLSAQNNNIVHVHYRDILNRITNYQHMSSGIIEIAEFLFLRTNNIEGKSIYVNRIRFVLKANLEKICLKGVSKTLYDRTTADLGTDDEGNRQSQEENRWYNDIDRPLRASSLLNRRKKWLTDIFI